MTDTIRGYKLFRVSRKGHLHSLFIGKRTPLTIGEWLQSESLPTKGFAVRPGWHVCSEQSAPHLALDPVSDMPRVWAEVECDGWIDYHERPESQGGLWYTCERVRIVRVIRRGSVMPNVLIEADGNGFASALDFIEWIGRERWTGRAVWNDGKGIIVRDGWIKESRHAA